MNPRPLLVTVFSLAFLFAPSVFAQAKPEESVSSADNEFKAWLRELEAENSRLQQEVIRLRNLSLQSQASIRLREQVIERYAQQTDSMTTAQLNLIDQHKRLISAVRTMQSSPETARKNPSFGDVLTAIGVGMASSNATSRTESLTDALTAYSNSLNTSSTSYLREIRALNSQRENRHSQQRMELLLNDLSNTLNGAQFNNGFWWKQR